LGKKTGSIRASDQPEQIRVDIYESRLYDGDTFAKANITREFFKAAINKTRQGAGAGGARGAQYAG
jgi:hypothetical protein